MNALLGIANALYRFLERIANASGWLLIVLMFVTCVDVLFRKLGVVGFPYTKAQEMEWHLHTAIFSLWMGFNYCINAHPRVDSYTEKLGYRRKAWIELAGCLVFALPYMLVLVWYGWDFVKTAWVFNESSDAALGLPYRWIIKAIMYAGLWLLVLGIVSVMLRLIVFLFGNRPAEEVDLRIGHAESEV
ncbi:MAG TPA: TRAP transporter small permease subunit [Burkholderiales bacterium]|nr:TRAP transporter small permease subunit [Burkholderiales bacterium]